jgi:lysophospholipase L1-like esterase
MTTLFLGSSIIERWDTDIPINNYVNLGISGLTTNELMEYYSILSKYKCTKIEKIIIYIGSNDIVKKNQPDKIVDNIY